MAVDVEHLFLQGIAHADAARHDEAEACFAAVLANEPGHSAALFNRAMALHALGRADEAIGALVEVLRRHPDHHDTLFNLAAMLNAAGRRDEALALFVRLLARQPDYPGVAYAVGAELLRRDRPEQAEPCLRIAAMLDPGSAQILNNLGASLMAQRHAAPAEPWFARAATIAPTEPDYAKNLGIAQLTQGKLRPGFRNYEWRRGQPVWGWNRAYPGKPEWRGEPIEGRRILVYFEQGLGDSLQFVRYLPLLRAMDARTIFLCQPVLRDVLATAPGIDMLVADGDPLPDFDCHVSLMSLPDRCGTTLATIPADIPYLRADPALVALWGARLPPARFRIGVHWQSNGPTRDIPTEALAPLAEIAEIAGVQLVSLQPRAGAERPLLDAFGILPREALAEGGTSFADTAAIIAHLDLAICCDSSVTHLAGAIGLPVLLVLPWLGDWRWMQLPDSTPWYPAARLFRSERPDEWEAPIRAAARAAAAIIAARG